MNSQLTTHEESIIESLGIYKGKIIQSLIVQYKQQNINYNLEELVQLSRKSLLSLKSQNKTGAKF